MKKLLQPARLGVMTLLVFAAVAAAPGAATAQTIDGTATGKTIAQGNGTFRIVGTFTDPSTPGIAGTYVGTYVEETTGYTSCRFINLGSFFCIDPANVTCNLIRGSVTIRSRGESQRFLIGADFPRGRAASAVCLNASNPEIHDVFLFLTGVDSASNVVATGSMRGTSTPLAGGVYEDAFRLEVTPCTCT
jgi:hypothetical protein